MLRLLPKLCCAFAILDFVKLMIREEPMFVRSSGAGSRHVDRSLTPRVFRSRQQYLRH